MQPDARIAIVVITWNRRKEILRTLAHLTELPERPQIILVDNGSTDDTVKSVERFFPQAKIIEAGRNLGSAARNLGVEATTAPYVAFCDDDTWWEPYHLSVAADFFDSYPLLALIMARVVVGKKQKEDPICREIVSGPLPAEPATPGYPLVGFLAGASIIRRTAFLEAGGYRSDLGIGGEEDWMAADLMALGWRLVYLPQFCVHHFPAPHRDPRLRRRQLLLNGLCFAWLRRPWRSALRYTARVSMESPWDLTTLSGITGAFFRIVRRWGNREVVPPYIEKKYQLLERHRKLPRSSMEDTREFVDAVGLRS